MSAPQAPPGGQRPPAWPEIAAWLLAAALAALLAEAAAYGETWSEAQALRHFAEILVLFGVGFVLSSYFRERSVIYRYLAYTANRAWRWYETSGLLTGGKPRATGWLCLGLAALVLLGSFLV